MSATCGRCGGTGRHGPVSVEGGVCFACRGRRSSTGVPATCQHLRATRTADGLECSDARCRVRLVPAPYPALGFVPAR